MGGAGAVLVIDDEPVLQDVLGTLLLGAGFDYHGATTAADGLQQLRDEEIDVVLLDLRMPGMDGIEICRMLRADPRTASVPIIMVTARVEEIDRLLGLELGAGFDEEVETLELDEPADREDAVERARGQLPSGESLERCEDCDAIIPEARRIAVPAMMRGPC